MKLHLNISLRKALLAAMAAVATCAWTLPTAQATLMHSDTSVMVYTDFAQNDGRYVTDAHVNSLLSYIRQQAKGVAITYTGGQADYILPHGMIDFTSTVDGGYAAGIGVNWLATVDHNGVINPTFTSWELGDSYAVHYAGIEYRYSDQFKHKPSNDYKVTRLSKIVTDVTTSAVYSNTAKVDANNGNGLDGELLYRNGGGTMYRVNLDGSWTWLLGAYSYTAGGIMTMDETYYNATDKAFSTVFNMNATHAGTGTATNPLAFGIYSGDSGSPTWIWNEETGQYEYLNAMQSGGGTFSQARGNVSFTLDVMEMYNKTVQFGSGNSITIGAASTQGTETITDNNNVSSTPWHGTVTVDGGEAVDYIGTKTGVNTWKDLSGLLNSDTWFSYGTGYLNTGSVSLADLYSDSNLILKAASSTVMQTVNVNETVDTGVGYVEFALGDGMETASYTVTGSGQLNTAGFVVDKGVDLHMQLTGDASFAREWRKTGAGDLYIEGTGDNNKILLNLGGSGTTYLKRTDGYAAYNVLASTGAKVVIDDLGQIERDITLGNDGGTLDMNGLSMTWNNGTDGASQENAFTIHALDECAVITNSNADSATTLTWTQSGTQTWLGSFKDTEGGALRFIYNGGGALNWYGIATDLSHNDASGITVASGTLMLSGSITEHARGSATGTSANRLVRWNDWHYSDATTDVLVQDGGTFKLGSHARLTGDVSVENGGTFIMYEGVQQQQEYVEGGSSLEDTDLYRDYFGLKGNVSVASGGSMQVTFSSGVTSTLNYAGDITGEGSLTVALGQKGKLRLSGKNTISGEKTLTSGGIIAATRAALGDTSTNKWKLATDTYLASEDFVADTDANTILSYIDSSSTGALALTESRTGAIQRSGLFIGALAGHTVEYGSSTATLSAVDGKWLLGGGGGQLNVDFLLNDAEGELVIGSQNSSGTVKLTNTSNKIGSITIGGIGNQLIFDDVKALGGGKVTVAYGNELNIGQGVGGMLDVVDYDKSTGVLAIDTAEGAESVSTDLNMNNFHNTVLGAAGEVTYTGTLTANSSGVYAFGGRGSLTLDTNLTGSGTITMDGQGLSGGSVIFAQANGYTGTVKVGGGSGTGDISLRFGVNNALSHASSVVLQAGGKIVLDGVADAPIVRNLSSTGGSIVNETSTRQTLVLDYTQAGTTSNGLLGSNINVVKTGSGTLSLGTQSSFNGILTIDEGTVSAGQNSLASSGVYNIGEDGVLDLSLTKCTTKNLSAANVSQVINGTGTLRMHSGGTILGSSASGSSFTGTIELTGNTRIMVGSGFDIGTGTKQSTLAALNGATIRVASGSQALVSNQFAGNSSTTRITTSACFEIGGGSYSGYRSNTINLDVAGTGGALRIDNGSTVTGTVKLLEDATITSLNYVDKNTASVSYGNSSCLGGTILGVISGDGKNLTLSGSQRLSFRADAANSFNNLKITNNNGVEGCAFRLEKGAAASTTSTAMGLGTVSTSGSQAIQFYNAGTDDNSIVYTYANNMSLASGAKLESDYNATRLTGTVSTAGTLNLATRVNGSYVSRLMLENGISGGSGSIVNISAGSYVGLGGNNTFSGTINAGAGATLSLLSTGAVNSGVTLSYTDSLTLNLEAEGAYSLAALTSSSETTALTLNFDYESAGRTTSTLTLSSTLVAQTASVNLTLNEANQLKKGTYQLIAGDVSGTDFTLASSDLNGRITLEDRGTEGLYMVVDADSTYYWRGGQSQWWYTDANWYTDGSADPVVYSGEQAIIFDNDSRSDIVLNGTATVKSMVVKDKAISMSGSGTLTGADDGQLTVMQGGQLTFSSYGQATFRGGTRVLEGSQLKLVGSTSFTGDIASTGTGVATIGSGSTLTGNLNLSEGGSARVEGGTVNGTANVADGTLTVANTSSTDMAVSLQGGATLAVEGTNNTGNLTLSGTNTISGEANSTLTVASMDNPKGTTTTIDGTTLAVTTGVLKSSGNARPLNGSSTTNIVFANGGVLDDRNSYYGLTGTLNVNGEGVMHIDGIRLSNENGTGKLNVNSGSTLVVHGAQSTVSSNTSALTAAGSFMLSHWAASNANAVNILGTLTINSWVTNWDGEATINVKNGGTFNMLGGMSWGTNYRQKTVWMNVEDGARLNAAGGAQSAYLNVKFKAGSTLGIGLKEGTTATLGNNMQLGTANTTGSVTVDTTVQRFDSTSLLQTVSTEAGTMVLNGTLTDAGTTTLNVIGSGTLKLGSTATLNGGITAEGSATVALGTASISAADTTQSFGISGPLNLAVSDAISLSGTEDSSLLLNNSSVALKGADLKLSYVDFNGSDLRAEGTSALHLQTEDQTVGTISVAEGGELTLDGNMVTATKASLGANSSLKLSGGATLKLGTPDLAIGVGDNTGTISTTTALDSVSLASSDLSISAVNMALYSGSHEINAALSDTSLMLTGGSSAVLKGTQALSSLTISAGSSVTVDSAADLTLSGSILSAGTLELNATSYKMTTTGGATPATVYADGEDYYNGFVQGWYFVETVGNATTTLADGATLSLNGGEAMALTVRSDGSILVGNSGTDKNYYVNTAVTYGANSCKQDNADLSAIKLAGGTLTVNSSAVPTKTALITGNGGLTLGEGAAVSDTVLASDSTVVLNGTGTLSHATDNANKALSTGISFGSAWTGTVSLTNTGSSRWENVDLNTYGTSISTVELKGVNAWLNTTASTTALNTDWSWADGTDKTVRTYTPNIRLTNPDSNTAAFKLVDGSSKNVYKLVGTVSGEGTLEVTATGPNNIGVQFSGNVSGWDGAFVQNTNGRQGYVVFSDSATTVNADVTAKVGTLYTMVRNAADVTFNGDITQEGNGVNNLQLALGGIKTFNSAVSVTNASISGGAAVFNGTTTVSGTFTTDAAVSIGNAGSLTLSGTGSTTTIGTLTNNGSLSSAGTLTVDTYTGTGNVSNSGTMTLGGSVTGTLTNTGTLTLGGVLAGGGSTTGALTLLGSGTTFHSGAELSFSGAATLTLGSDTLDYGEYSVGAISGSIIGANNRVSIANLAADRVATYYAETGLIKVTDAIYSLVWNGTTANHVWDKTESDWLMGSEEKPFTDGSSVTFTGNGNSTVTLAASVEVEKLSLTGTYSLEVAEGEKSLSVVTTENLGGSFTKTGSGTLQMEAATANALRMSLSAGTLQLDTLSGGSANLGRITATGGTLQLGVANSETAEVKLGTFEKASTIEITSGSIVTPVTNDEFAGVKLNAGTALELKGYGQAVQMGATVLNGSAALTMKDMQATTALSGNGTLCFDNASLTTTDALNSTLTVSGKGTLTADSVTGGSYTLGKDTTLAAANGLNGAGVTMKDGSALSTSGTVSTLTVDSGSSIALNGAGSGMTLSNELTVDGLTTTGTVTVNANITIGNTIMNSGTLALNGSRITATTSGSFIIDANNPAYDNYFSAGDNGYFKQGCVFVEMGGDISMGSGTNVYINNSQRTATIARGGISVYLYSGRNYGAYYVNSGETTYDVSLQYDATAQTGATSLAMRGGTLNLTTALTNGTTIDSMENKTSTVNIASGVTLDADDLNVQQGSVALKLNGTAAVTDGGVTYTAKDETTSLTATAEGLSATNAILTAGSGATGDIEINGKLTNADLVNSSTYTLSETNAESNAFNTVHAEAGDIVMLNKETEVSVSDLTIGAGHSVSVSSTAGFSEATEGTLALNGGSLTAGSGSRLNADIIVSNATVNLAQGGLAMGSTLTLGSGNTYANYDAAVAALKAGSSSYTLFTGVDELVVGGSAYSSPVDANSVFSNIESGVYSITYSGADDGVVALAYTTPEPATATLSLLALAALAARRRRKCSL